MLVSSTAAVRAIVVAVVLLLGGAVLAVVNHEDSAGSVAVSDGGDSGDAGPIDGVPTVPDDDDRAGSTTTTLFDEGPQGGGGAPADTTPPPVDEQGVISGPLRAPRVGTYRYRTVMEEEGGERQEDENTLEVHDDGPGKQRHVREIAGQRVESFSSYGDQGHVESAIKVAGLGNCPWTPTLLRLPAGHDPGTSWSVDSRCEGDGEQVDGDVHVVGTSEVLERKVIDFLGRKVEVITVRRVERQEFTFSFGPGQEFAGSNDEDTTYDFAPALGLVLRSSGSQTTTTPDPTNPAAPPSVVTRKVTSELLSLDPS